ncbi:MAG: SRPBCC family protein [Hamadaea sp.]|nr:SRPBCC family protein [Hamadaea sp.]
MNVAFDPRPTLPVTAHSAGDRWTLVFVKDLAHPPERVWAALTEPGQVSAWAPFRADRDLSAPGRTTLAMVDGDTTVDLPAEILRSEPPKLLEYKWGDDLLRWELTPTEAGTRLTLHHTVGGRDLLAKVAAGWHLCLLVAEKLLDGAPIPPIRGQEALGYGWRDLHDEYAEKMQ